MAQHSGQPEQQPGYFQGLHYTAYVEEVKALKRTGDEAQFETLLLALVDATEAEARMKKWGVAPWYYEELAKLYHTRKDYTSELAILERFARQQHAPGVKPAQLLERLEKVRAYLHHQ